MGKVIRLLLLGGTGEAAELARGLSGTPGLTVITSLAGRTRKPHELPGEVRVGGFGGVAGLVTYLQDQAIDLVVDATHPFAATMAANAAAACDEVRLPRLKLHRPPWPRQDSDRWIDVPSADEAAAALPGLASRVFLTTGRQDIAAFTPYAETWFLVRLIDRPAEPLPLQQYELILARGPFQAKSEADLMSDHGIEALVSKNSGGNSTYGKIAAARLKKLPVIMIERPAVPSGEIVDSVEEALEWIAKRLA